MEAAPRVLGDLPVDLLDLVVQFLSVNGAHLQSSMLYQLRRLGWWTSSTMLISKGLDVKVVQARLRHASAKTTLDTYGHLWPDI